MPDPDAPSGAAPLRKLLEFERLLAELSARFVNLPAAEVDGAITDALRQIVVLLDVDRSQLIRFARRGGEVEITHSWAVDGVPAVPPKSIADDYPWAARRLRAGEPVVVPRLDDLPPEAAVDAATWRRVGVKSNFTMPLRVAGRVEGAIALGCLRHSREWPEALVARCRVLAEVLANALAHKRAQEALDAAMGFERTVSGVLAALLTAARSEQDRVIEAGLADLARAFGVERATLWQRVGDQAEFTKTHRWAADGAPAPPESGRVITTWISAQVAAGVPVRFASHADLPPAAAADLASLLARGVRAGVVVPLVVSGGVVGALSFATSREDRDWPDALLPQGEAPRRGVREPCSRARRRSAANRKRRPRRRTQRASARWACSPPRSSTS